MDSRRGKGGHKKHDLNGVFKYLLPGDITAEETGLDPVNSDENTVAG